MVETRILTEYPDSVRVHVLDILKTGRIQKTLLNEYDIHYYLEVGRISPPLKNACEEKLLENLNGANCIDALDIADQYELLTLRKESIELLVNNFDKLWNTSQFQTLSEKNLFILCNIEKIAKHKDIYPALQNWLGRDHKKRFSGYLKLLDELQQRRTTNRQISCSEKYSEYHAMLMTSAGKSKSAIVTAVFNCDGEIVCHRNIFKSSDIKDDISVTCVQRDESQEPYVYILSGKHVFRYDPMLNKNTVCQRLCHSRVQGSLVTLDNVVYAIGGQHGGKDVSEIEALETKQKTTFKQNNKWRRVTNAPEGIKLCKAPCESYKDNIYIIGEKSQNVDPSTVVLEFCPHSKTIEIVGEFPKRCSDCRTVRHGSSIFISSSEGYFLKFDTETRIFTSCTDFVSRGQNVEMYLERDKIYIVGEDQDENSSHLVKHEYDLQTNSWKVVRRFKINSKVKGVCSIKVPSYTNIVPFYENDYKEEIGRAHV